MSLVFNCKHLQFQANVKVDPFPDMNRHIANLQIRCKDCGMRFRFEGLKQGVDFAGVACSEDGATARLSIVPADGMRLAAPGDDLSILKG